MALNIEQWGTTLIVDLTSKKLNILLSVISWILHLRYHSGADKTKVLQNPSLASWILILLVSQAFEDPHHGVGDWVNHFVVMVAEGHLNIQTHKLGQVAVRVGVLRPENWWDADLMSASLKRAPDQFAI